MLERFNIKILGGAFVVVILLCVGIYFYAEWSNKRFASELGAPPQFTAASEPTSKTKSDKVPPVEETSSIEVREFVSEDTHKDAVVSEPEPVETSESMNEDILVEAAETSESPSKFDATPLLSAFGLPEEVIPY
jgi:hypothetical protein